MTTDYYLVYYKKELVNVVQAPNWVEANRITANTRDDKDWKNYDSKWLHPKFHSRYNVGENSPATDSSDDVKGD